MYVYLRVCLPVEVFVCISAYMHGSLPACLYARQPAQLSALYPCFCVCASICPCGRDRQVLKIHCHYSNQEWKSDSKACTFAKIRVALASGRSKQSPIRTCDNYYVYCLRNSTLLPLCAFGCTCFFITALFYIRLSHYWSVKVVELSVRCL